MASILSYEQPSPTPALQAIREEECGEGKGEEGPLHSLVCCFIKKRGERADGRRRRRARERGVSSRYIDYTHLCAVHTPYRV